MFSPILLNFIFILYTDASQHMAAWPKLMMMVNNTQLHLPARSSTVLKPTGVQLKKPLPLCGPSLDFITLSGGSSSKTVFSDHDPLRHLINNVAHSSKLTRWTLAIQQYDVRSEHTKGKFNLLADGLSR